MSQVLAKFVAAFRRGIEGELAAMRASEAYETPLARGEDLGGMRYSFEVSAPDKLAPGTVCSLKTPRGDQRVVIERVDDDRITIAATQHIDTAGDCALIVAPWFLYDRLIGALDEVQDAPLSLTLFGNQPPKRDATA